MLTLEIVSKKRRPIKLYAIYGLLAGVLIIILVGIFHNDVPSYVLKILMGVSAFALIISLFIMNYSYKFKNPVGSISFSTTGIEIDILGNKEVLSIESIDKIRFKLVGYEGLNTSTFSDFLIVPILSLFSYHSGINNFIFIKTHERIRKFEIYIPDKNNWESLKSVVQYYKNK
jgi:hypothetical protein